jgi:hypothetical protein
VTFPSDEVSRCKIGGKAAGETLSLKRSRLHRVTRAIFVVQRTEVSRDRSNAVIARTVEAQWT